MIRWGNWVKNQFWMIHLLFQHGIMDARHFYSGCSPSKSLHWTLEEFFLILKIVWPWTGTDFTENLKNVWKRTKNLDFLEKSFQDDAIDREKNSKSKFWPFFTLFRTFGSISVCSFPNFQSKHSLTGYQINLIAVHFELEAFRSQNWK